MLRIPAFWNYLRRLLNQLLSNGLKSCLPLLGCLNLLLISTVAEAGELTRHQIKSYFPDALNIGEKLAEVPVWPIYKLDGWTEDEVAWVFESVDIAPIPGFAGVPPNLLIALDKRGNFVDVRVLSQEEPVFQDGLGIEPLLDFIAQYAGLNLLDNLKVRPKGAPNSDTAVYLDGITKATASVKIINETILASALKVARAKLGYASGNALVEAMRVRRDHFERLTLEELREAGVLRHLLVDADDIDQHFVGTEAEGDPKWDRKQRLKLEVAYLNIPSVGRNLLGEAGWNALHEQTPAGFHAIWIHILDGVNPFTENFIRGAVTNNFLVRQNGLPFNLRDLDIFLPNDNPASSEPPRARIFGIAAETGFDPGTPWQLETQVVRTIGSIMPRTVSVSLSLDYFAPKRFFEKAKNEAIDAWRSIWRERLADILILTVALTMLSICLVYANNLCASKRKLSIFRWAFLSFTLCYLGWWSQGQLSIVHFLALFEQLANALRGSTWSLTFYLYDPITLIVLIFTLGTLVIWGRGTFCGWLCPYGALQEFVAKSARLLGINKRHLSEKMDRKLRLVPHIVLAVLIFMAVLGITGADTAVEIEPFKTAITLGFDRSLLPVLYAVIILLFSAIYYKLFCRYLCPLGALLSIGGLARRWNWLKRRIECGNPCQVCRRTCDYGAIEASGKILYKQCFQCLDCVVVYEDIRKCPPLRRIHKAVRSTDN